MSDIKDELLQKILDPKFYLENFVKIKGKVPGLMPFILNEAQKDLFNTLNTESRVIILKARQMGFCLSPETKVLTSNLEWVSLDSITIGQEIVSVDEDVDGGSGSSRKMRKAIVEGKWDVHEESYRITLDDGRVFISTAGHRFLQKVRGAVHTTWRTVGDTHIGDEIRSLVTPWGAGSYEDGWFGGMIDGEGSLSQKSRAGASLNISQVAGPVLDRLLRYAKTSGFNYRIEWDNRESGNFSKLGDKPVCKVVFSNMEDIFSVIGKTRPIRMLSRDWWTGKKLPGNGHSWAKVVSIESIGKQRMVDLQTSEKTFIAEGLVSHNSTAVTGYLYHKTISVPGTTTALIGYNSDLTAELLDKVKTFYQTTPESIRPRILYNSKYEISFPAINSKILVLPSSENVGRGYTLHNVLCTELAFWEKASEKMLAIENSVPANGKIIIESTPSGMGTQYHRMWMSDNGYVKKKYGWYWGYSEEEIELIRRRINNPMKFAQEYELEFMSSGRPVFGSDLIKRLRKGIFKLGDKVKDADGNESTVTKSEDGVVMYFQPKPGRTYVLGADVSEGVTGGDYSVFTIFDRKSGDEVAFWRGHIPPEKFGHLIDTWGRFYNNSLSVIENNNHGLTTITALKNKMYPQMYFQPSRFDKMGTTYTDRLGFRTTKVTRPLLIDDLREAMADGSYKIHTESTVDELLTFVYDDHGDAMCQSGFHDDCIFASALCLQGFKIMFGGTLSQIPYEEHLPNGY